jgi:hypothetical protein
VLLRRDSGRRAAAPEISGGAVEVSAAISDRRGGFYVAGNFGRVGSWRASNVVHLLANGRIDRGFKAATDGGVLALALSGHRLFLGGGFVRIDGRERRRLGAVDSRTGQVTNWHPRLGVPHGAGLGVHALLLGRGVLYAGGGFRTVRGRVRRNLAALRLSDGRPTSFDARLPISYAGAADLDGLEQTPVLALALRDHALYVGSDEDDDGVRTSLRAVDPRTGRQLPRHVQVTGQVRALAVSRTSVIASGCALQYQLGTGPLASLVVAGVLGAFSRRRGSALSSPASPVAIRGACGTRGATCRRFRFKATICTSAARSGGWAAEPAARSRRSTCTTGRRRAGTRGPTEGSPRWQCRAGACSPEAASRPSAGARAEASPP